MEDSDNTKIKIQFGLAEFEVPEYWYEYDRLHCTPGSSIGYDERPMTEKEAIALSASAGVLLSPRAAAEIGKQKE